MGKSSLLLIMLLSIATGRQLLGRKVHKRRKVAYWSGEDNREEVMRRLKAACLLFKITHEEIDGWLTLLDPYEMPLEIAEERVLKDRGKTIAINELTVKVVSAFLTDNEIEVLAIDPMVDTHSLQENDNGAINKVMKGFKMIAQSSKSAVILAHHIAKGSTGENSKVDPVDAARGATAIINASRIVLVLRNMNENDRSTYEIDQEHVAQYVEIVDAKANLSLKGLPTYIQKASVDILNGDEDYPEGDSVGVVKNWTPTAEQSFDRVERMYTALQFLVQEHEKEIGEGQIFSHDQSSAWCGIGLAGKDVFNVSIGEERAADKRSNKENDNRSMIKSILTSMVDCGLIEVGSVYRPDTRKHVPCYMPRPESAIYAAQLLKDAKDRLKDKDAK